jgi:cyclohexadieny/prephenate dehydrogenase
MAKMAKPRKKAKAKAASARAGVMFGKAAIIGIGLIGGSMALALRQKGLAKKIVGADSSAKHCAIAVNKKIVDEASGNFAKAVKDADLVVLCVPVSAMGEIAKAIAPHLKKGAIVTDVGSVKQAVVHAMQPFMPKGVHFIPAHPIAGTEHSGPNAALVNLFEGRWCVITPVKGSDPAAVKKLTKLWEALGSKVKIMDAPHHDKVLAITSHLPHLIAYTIVGTASDLGRHLKDEVIRFSASGFRDFTRVAASDPVMWRDVFLNNKDAVLEIIQRFSEDLTALQRAIRWGEGDKLYKLFSSSRAIRRQVLEQKQDTNEPMSKRKP